MKKYKFAIALSSILIGIGAAGCSDDKWEPGPEDNDTGVKAYFVAPKTTTYNFGSDYQPEDMNITLTVGREITEGEATVGVTLKSDAEGFSIPSSVTFADGEEFTTLSINCSGVAGGAYSKCTVYLADNQVDTYGPGLTEVSLSAIQADWLLLSDGARYLYSDANYKAIYPETYGMLYQLEGTKIFKLTDFFGSGLDITFECNKPQDDVLYPLQNADFESVYEEDKEDLGWYLYDDANSSWPSWTPGGVTGYPAITYLLFYSSSYYNVCSMVYDEKELYGYIALTAGVNFSDGDFKWGNFQVDFYLMYNPFETTSQTE